MERLCRPTACTPALTYYHDSDGFVMAQYIPSQMNCEWKGTGVRISQAFDERVGRVNLADDTNSLDGPIRRPDSWTVNIDVLCESPTRFVLRLRKPGVGQRTAGRDSQWRESGRLA